MIHVYRHRRLDTFEVFYIGIGNEKRPHSKKGRSKYWRNIVNKHGYQIEILTTCKTWEEACELEELLISEYGRKDLGTGCLINMTDGGEGSKGRILSEATKNKIKENSPLNKEIHVYLKNGTFYGTFNSLTECSEELNVRRSDISSCIVGTQKSTKGYMFSLVKKHRMKTYKGNTKKVHSEMLNMSWESIRECSSYLNLCETYVSKMIKGVKNNKYNLVLS